MLEAHITKTTYKVLTAPFAFKALILAASHLHIETPPKFRLTTKTKTSQGCKLCSSWKKTHKDAIAMKSITSFIAQISQVFLGHAFTHTNMFNFSWFSDYIF